MMCDHLFPYGGNDLKWVRLGKQRPRCFIDVLAPCAAGKIPGPSRPNLPILWKGREISL